jgi:hypothetical protein
MTKTQELFNSVNPLGIPSPRVAFQQTAGLTERSLEDRLRETVSVKDFGAIGDGVTNDSDAIEQAILAANGRTVFFEGGKTYRITRTLAFTGVDISLESLGIPAVILQNGQSFHGFDASGTEFLATSLAASQAMFARTWTLASTAGVQPGMIMEVKSSLPWYYNPRTESTDARKSELHVVESVVGSTVRTFLPANDGYNLAAESVEIKFYSPIKVRISNITFKATPIQGTTQPRRGVRIRYSVAPTLLDLTTDGYQASGLNMTGCYDGRVIRHTGINANYFSNGYGAHTTGSTRVLFSDCTYRGCRRGVDISGANIISMHCVIENCINFGGGRSSNGNVWGFTDAGAASGGSPNYGFGSHGPADHTTYKNNVTHNYFGINVRGGDERIIGNTFYGNVTRCVTINYGSNHIVKDNISVPDLENKNTARYAGGANIFNFIPNVFVLISDDYTPGGILEVSGNSGFVNTSIIEFASGAVIPTSRFALMNNNFTILSPTSSATRILINNLNSSTDPLRNTTPTVPIFMFGNRFVRSGTGPLVFSNNITFSPIQRDYTG